MFITLALLHKYAISYFKYYLSFSTIFFIFLYPQMHRKSFFAVVSFIRKYTQFQKAD